MFNSDNEIDPLQEQITNLYSQLAGFKGSDEEFDKITDQIVKLKKLQKEVDSPWIPSPDAAVGALASVLGIVLVLHYEKIGVVTSKALGFVKKLT